MCKHMSNYIFLYGLIIQKIFALCVLSLTFAKINNAQ